MLSSFGARSFQNSTYNRSTALYRSAFASLALAIMPTGEALALPSGGNVVGGNATITNPTATDVVVNQTTNKAIIDWQSFDILNDESARFNQPGVNSVTLNRVGGGSPTQILGKLSANGKLVVVNPNGVFFGATSTVDVAGLVATTADISNADFMAGRGNFDIAGNPDASIVNKGRITAAEGGLVALVAPGVRNDGIIQAKMGTVQLASAQTMTVDFYGDGLFSFAVGEQTNAVAKDENGNALNAAVENNGTITAQGGTILLTANAAKDIVTSAVNNNGIIDATAARVEGGTIVLDGGEGHTRVSGKVDVSGKGAGQKGGSVTVVGNTVELAGAEIDASGTNGGGDVRVGGDYQGQGDLRRSELTFVDEDSTIDVSAIEDGNGGRAIVWSDGDTQFDGLIWAKGGALNGDGGFVETSGGVLGVNGLADVTAANGAAGTWLLDPRNITIRARAAGDRRITCAGGVCTSTGNNAVVDVFTLEAALNSGANVEVLTGSGGAQAGNITVSDSIDWFGSGSLTLTALNNIILNADINSAFGSVTLDAARNIELNDSMINLSFGDATLTAGRNINLNGDSNISLSFDAMFDLPGIGAPGNATLTAGRHINLNDSSAINLGGGNAVLTANRRVRLRDSSTITTGGSITINNTGRFSSNTANSLNAGNGITLNQTTAGSIQNAIDAVGNTGTGSATLNLAAGTFDEAFVVDQAHFNIIGAGEGVTIIQPTALAADAAIILANAGLNTALTPVNISGLTVDGSQLSAAFDGVVYNATTGTIQNVTVNNGRLGNNGILFSNVANSGSARNNTVTGFSNGIAVINSAGSQITANTISNQSGDGIHISDSDNVTVLRNNAHGNRNGIHVLNGSDDVLVRRNETSANARGINVHDSNNVRLRGNKLQDDALGIRFADVTNGLIRSNTLTSIRGLGLTAVSVSRSEGVRVARNTVNSYFDGIGVRGSNNAVINSNTVTGVRGALAGTGISLINSDGATMRRNMVIGKNVGFFVDRLTGLTFDANTTVANNVGAQFSGMSASTIANNFFDNNIGNGFEGDNLDGATISGNSFSSNGADGALLTNVSNSNINGSNQFFSNRGIGLNADMMDTVDVSGNSFSGNSAGALLSNATDLTLNNNSFTRNRVGVSLFDSDGAVFTGDIFNGNMLGIQLNNASNTTLQNQMIATSRGGTGIQIENGSGGTLVGGLNVTGGDVGVLLDGAGSDMQFVGNDSVFDASVDFYFVLQNAAMQGQTLDASQQTFARTRASNATLAQLAAAEAKVIDDDTTVTVGDVSFEFLQTIATAIDTNSEEAEDERDGLFRVGLFSYSGRTLNNNIQRNQFSFDAGKVNLSLLNATPLPQATPTGIANFFATLSPAAGGENAGGTPSPAGLAQQLSELNPAAGGGCGNNFLAGGFSGSFSADSCAFYKVRDVQTP